MMPDRWPTPWLTGHRADCADCAGTGTVQDRACRPCRGTGIVSKPPEQIVAETVAANRSPA